MPFIARCRTIRAISLIGSSIGLAAVFLLAASRPAAAQDPPKYQVDPAWPRELPNNWIMGQVGGMAVDKHDHIWVLQRPATTTPDELGASLTPPRSMCCLPTPPVLEFDTQGNLLQSWGGPGEGYDWPKTEHGIYVDRDDNVWIGSNSPDGDRQVLKFTANGKFLKQIGHPSKDPYDSARTDILGRTAGIEVDADAHAVREFIARVGIAAEIGDAAIERPVSQTCARIHVDDLEFLQHEHRTRERLRVELRHARSFCADRGRLRAAPNHDGGT